MSLSCSTTVPRLRCAAFLKGKQKEEEGPRFTPRTKFTDEYLKKKPDPPKYVPGDLAKSSIFEDEEQAGPTGRRPDDETKRQPVRDPHIMAAALNPRPEARLRWQRKMVVREICKRGRLNKAQLIQRHERQLVSKSHDFKTSVKKLTPLARQITGKSLKDAITQMRFSKKNAAKEVKEHLIHARNQAIVERGMGLARMNNGSESGVAPVNIVTKDKKHIKVADPTSIYVDQAWVGKGLYGKSYDHRAYGRIFIMKNPTTSITVILKEERHEFVNTMNEKRR